MRGCSCRGLTLCAQCHQLAQRAGVLTPPEAPPVSEAVFQAAVVRLAREHGWLVYHNWLSKRSPEGFPDLICVHPTQRERPVLAWELKTATGQVTQAQQAWVEALDHRHTVSAVLRPEDLPTIRRWLC